MALLLAVAVALVAGANAGMMMMPQQQGNMMQGNMMQGNMMNMGMQGMQGMQGGQMMVPMGNSGCHQDSDGNMPAGCAIPMQEMDMEEYLEQQMKQQQYETNQMAEKIKAQFEGMVREVNMKKYRMVMSLVAEYISFCECASSSYAVYSTFLDTAMRLNLTDGVEIWDPNRQPYQAVNEEDARGLIFSGLVRTMCETAGRYNSFAEQVFQRIPAFRTQGKK